MCCIVTEPVTLQLTVSNPLQLPLTLAAVRLLWHFNPEDGSALISNEMQEVPAVAETQVLASLTLEPGMKQQVSLSVTPRQLGELRVQAFAFELCGPVSNEPTIQAPISVPGMHACAVK